MSQFLGSDGARLAMLDDGTSAVGVYMVYSTAGMPFRAFVYNSEYYAGASAGALRPRSRSRWAGCLSRAHCG